MAQNRVAVEELVKHRHAENTNGIGADGWDNSFGALVTLPNKSTGPIEGYANYIYKDGAWITGAYRVYTDYAGSDKPHNTLQPSKAVYIWTRTA